MTLTDLIAGLKGLAAHHFQRLDNDSQKVAEAVATELRNRVDNEGIGLVVGVFIFAAEQLRLADAATRDVTKSTPS